MPISGPIASNATEAGKVQNRRVEVLILPPPPAARRKRWSVPRTTIRPKADRLIKMPAPIRSHP